MKLCYLDFEFNSTAEPKLNLVSVVAVAKVDGKTVFHREFWLYQRPSAWAQAAAFFRHVIAKGYTFVGYTEAEPRSLRSLGITEAYPYIDLYLEYRCLLNNNNEMAYGEQYIKGKLIKTTPPPPKWMRAEVEDSDDDSHHEPSYSLAAATYKLLGVMIDTVEKNTVRDIIISNDAEKIQADRDRILLYNASDIVHMPTLLRETVSRNRDLGILQKTWLEHALKRGEYSLHTARMIETGYPVDTKKLKAFTSNVDKILAEAAKACNEVHEPAPFKFDKRFQRYTLTEKVMREWIGAQAKPKWRKTDSGRLSLSKDSFNDWYDSESEGLGGAFYRYLKTKQSLNGFLPGVSKRGKFTDHLGSDGRARPHFGIYGSQSSRSQPRATGFIPLKAHWMRNFIQPKPGRACVGVDYSSQEFLIAAIVSQDEAMLAAYETGDVYMAFAKAAGLVPPSGTKTSHKKERDLAKTIVLGMSYDMGAKSLAARLTVASGKTWTEEEGENVIETFTNLYPDYAQWKKDTLEDYEAQGWLALPDGWTMWGDNDNRRSVTNFPIQGLGAVVMREAVSLCHKRGLDVIFTLHDAIYVEHCPDDSRAILELKFSMQEAFEKVMQGYGKTVPIRLDGHAWGEAYRTPPLMPVPGVEYTSEYVDAKGKKDLERYRKYFT